MNSRFSRFTVHGALAAFVLALLLVGLGTWERGASHAAGGTGDAELSLNATGASVVTCDSQPKPSKCTVAASSTFTLVISMNTAPPSGYAFYSLVVDHPGLISKARPLNADYYVDTFGFDIFPVAGIGTETFGAGGITSLSPPIPTTTYTGPLVEADLNCDATSTFKISIAVPPTNVRDANNDAISLTTADQGGEKVADTLTINCGLPTKLPDPGDTDGDGCSDQRENLPKSEASSGGGRDWQNPWDYYDTNGDQVIDLPNDILGVILHFSPSGAPPYDANFDRGVTIGTNHWQRAGPDGVIDLPNDILGIILQFQHNCAGLLP